MKFALATLAVVLVTQSGCEQRKDPHLVATETLISMAENARQANPRTEASEAIASAFDRAATQFTNHPETMLVSSAWERGADDSNTLWVIWLEDSMIPTKLHLLGPDQQTIFEGRVIEVIAESQRSLQATSLRPFWFPIYDTKTREKPEPPDLQSISFDFDILSEIDISDLRIHLSDDDGNMTNSIPVIDATE